MIEYSGPATQFPVKDPDSVNIHYGFEIKNMPSGVTVTNVAWTATGLTTGATANDGSKFSVALTGGTVGQQYTLRAHYTMSDGSEDDISGVIVCSEK